MRYLPAALLCAVTALAQAAGSLPAASVAAPRIAIIIDDLGYGFEAGRRTASLPGPVACAILPATPRGAAVAELAAGNGKEVLLHLPLEAQHAVGRIDPGSLRLDMSRGQFGDAFAANLDSVPHVSGVNSHRGSLLTRHPGHMAWLMEELRARDGLYFIDSYTTRHSVALALAAEAGVPARRRDVFLDNDRSSEALGRSFERLKRRARRQGAAIGIGHPFPETLAFLEQALPRLRDEGFALVPLSTLMQPAAAGDD